MASVDPVFAQWLQDSGLFIVDEDAALLARWGTAALRETQIVRRCRKTGTPIPNAEQ